MADKVATSEVRVADYIAQFVADLGIDTAFLIAGGQMMHLLDALRLTKGIQIICNHHEQACAMGAEAYARRSGKIGLCCTTSGPAVTNLMTGLVGAWQDSAPILFLTGQSKLSQTTHTAGIPHLRQFGVFEMDVIALVKDFTKYAVMLTDPADVRYHLEKAVYLATSGRPGPVVLDIPTDIQGALIDPATLRGFTPPAEAPADESNRTKAAQAVAEKLLQAKRPILLAGHGVRTAGATDLFRDLAARLNVPVVTTQLAKDLMPYNAPLFVGHCGPRGDRPGNFAVQTADVILSVGCSLHVTTTGYELDEFAPNAYKILVDPDESILRRTEVGVGISIDLKIQDDVAAFLPALDRAAGGRSADSDGCWKAVCAGWKAKYAVINEPHKASADNRPNYYRYMHLLSGLLRDDDTVLADAGNAYYSVGQALRAQTNQRVIVSGAMGSLGYTVPAAIGAAAAVAGMDNLPNKRIVGLTGDGSLQTNIQELAAISYHQLPVKLLVLNNEGYASMRNTQKSFFAGSTVASGPTDGVWSPPLDAIAAAYKIPYFRAESVDDLEATLRAALDSPGPAICEIMGQFDHGVMPTVPAMRMPDGSMKSKQLHEMNPPLSDEELQAIFTVCS